MQKDKAGGGQKGPDHGGSDRPWESFEILFQVQQRVMEGYLEE